MRLRSWETADREKETLQRWGRVGSGAVSKVRDTEFQEPEGVKDQEDFSWSFQKLLGFADAFMQNFCIQP